MTLNKKQFTRENAIKVLEMQDFFEHICSDDEVLCGILTSYLSVDNAYLMFYEAAEQFSVRLGTLMIFGMLWAHNLQENRKLN